MLLKLYDLNKTLIGGLKNCKDPKVESELSTGDKQLSFLWHPRNMQKIPHEYYIRTDTDEYVVKENSKGSNGYRNIVAKLNLEDIEGRAWKTFDAEERTAQECADMALVDTGWTCISTVGDKKRSFSLSNVNSYSVFEKICEAFTCERRFDTINKVVYLADKIGDDKGAYFMAGLNLTELTDKSDSYDYCTRIIPIGAEGLSIKEVNGGKEYLENYQYSDKKLTLVWEDTNYTEAQALKEDAEYKLNELSKPKKSYSAKTIDFSRLKPEYSILAYSVGDTVMLVENETGTREKQRITKTTEYLNNPDKNTCELANTVLSFADLQKQLFAAAACVNNITNGSNVLIGSNVKGMEAWQIGGLEAYIANNEEIADLKANYLYVSGELGAVKATIGEITTTYLKATEADLKFATIEKMNVVDANINNLKADYGEFKVVAAEDFTAVNGRINTLTGDFLDYQTIVAEDLIVAKGWMLEGSIGSAQISDLNANKIRSGIIDTALVSVASKDSDLIISGNQILVNDTTDPLNKKNRVILGQYRDQQDQIEYGLLVRTADGQTTMIDGDGVHNAGITDGAVDNNKVADDANISGKKLDIQSVVTEINEGETKISQTIIQVGDKSLDIILGEQTQKITDIEGKKMLRTEVISDDGYIFEDGNITCVFRAVVYSWDDVITDQIPESCFTWTRESLDRNFDAYWNENHKNYHGKTLTVNAEDVVVEDGKVITDVCFVCNVAWEI